MTGFLVVTDFSVPLRDVRQFHHVLAIFPHADDEAITCGGFLHHVSRGRGEQPEDMVTGPHVQERPAFPTHKIFIGVSVFPKIKSWYTYKSQRASFTKGIMKFLPIWFFLSTVLFEYFAEAS